MSQFTLRRVDPFSVAKVFAIVQASFGLLIGACLSAFSLLAGFASNALSQGSPIPGWIGPLFGMGAVIALPIFYGVIGFISGLIGGALYNFFASMGGGIRVEFDRELLQQ